jgi:hypothetical protein
MQLKTKNTFFRNFILSVPILTSSLAFPELANSWARRNIMNNVEQINDFCSVPKTIEGVRNLSTTSSRELVGCVDYAVAKAQETEVPVMKGGTWDVYFGGSYNQSGIQKAVDTLYPKPGVLTKKLLTTKEIGVSPFMTSFDLVKQGVGLGRPNY